MRARTPSSTRTRIMVSCGHSCAAMNSNVIDDVKAVRKKYESIDDFLDAEITNPEQGTRLAKEGGCSSSTTRRTHTLKG
jgi:hypothetical protein